MSTTTTATRRATLARRADAGTIATYVRQESSRAARRARPGARPPRVVRRQRAGGVPAGCG